jgi:hypothetical protein
MTLVRKFSKVFRSKSSDTSNNNQRTVAGPVIPPTICEDDEEQIIAATVTASLLDENTRLEAQLQEQTRNVTRLTAAASQNVLHINNLNEIVESQNVEKESLQIKLQKMTSNLRRSQSHVADLTPLNERLQTALTQVSGLTEENSRLKTENGALENDLQQLHTLNKRYQQDYQNLETIWRAKVTEKAKHNRELEQKLFASLAPMDEASLNAYNQRIGALRSNEEIETRFNTKMVSMTQEIGCIKDKLQSSRQENSQLRDQLQAAQTELEEEKGKNNKARSIIEALDNEAKSIIEALDIDRNNLMDELTDLRSNLSHLRSLVGDEITPRRVIAIKLFQEWFPRLREQPPPSSGRFLESHAVEHLNCNQLDMVMTDQVQIDAFLSSIAPGSDGHKILQDIRPLNCHVCKRPKFCNLSPTPQNRRLNEFPNRFSQTTCCQKSVCTACFMKSIKIAEDWWYDLGSQSWLECPVENCGRAMGIHSAEDFADLVIDSGERNIQNFKKMLVAPFTSCQAPLMVRSFFAYSAKRATKQAACYLTHNLIREKYLDCK